jgi:hypothetical protein
MHTVHLRLALTQKPLLACSSDWTPKRVGEKIRINTDVYEVVDWCTNALTMGPRQTPSSIGDFYDVVVKPSEFTV